MKNSHGQTALIIVRQNKLRDIDLHNISAYTFVTNAIPELTRLLNAGVTQVTATYKNVDYTFCPDDIRKTLKRLKAHCDKWNAFITEEGDDESYLINY